MSQWVSQQLTNEHDQPSRNSKCSTSQPGQQISGSTSPDKTQLVKSGQQVINSCQPKLRNCNQSQIEELFKTIKKPFIICCIIIAYYQTAFTTKPPGSSQHGLEFVFGLISRKHSLAKRASKKQKNSYQPNGLVTFKIYSPDGYS